MAMSQADGTASAAGVARDGRGPRSMPRLSYTSAVVRLFWASMVGLVLSSAIFGGLYLPSRPGESVFWIPFVLAVGCWPPTVYKLGGLDFSKLWQALRQLSPVTMVALGVPFIAITAQSFYGIRSGSNEVDFKRSFAGAGLWLCAASAALSYGKVLLDRHATSPTESVQAVRSRVRPGHGECCSRWCGSGWRWR